MKVEIITKQYNKVEAKVTLDNEMERNEILVGNIALYLKEVHSEFDTCCYVALVDNHKRSSTSKDIYACNLKSEKLKLKNAKYICDQSKWRLLVKYNKPDLPWDCYEFDLTLEAEIFITKNPFATLYDDSEMTDFELIGEDGSVKFHSAVLATASHALRRMLMGKWTETESRTLTVKDTSKETLQHLKDYLYMYKLPDNGVEHLLVLASYYIMTDLENKCINKILCSLTTENSTELARFALNHNLMKLYYSFLGLVEEGLIDVSSLQQREAASENEMNIP